MRVEPDPKLVDQLEAAKVAFQGVRPSFISQLLYGWALPAWTGVYFALNLAYSLGLKARPILP